MDKKSLFRSAAAEKNHVKWLGEIVLIRPLPVLFATSAAVAMAILIVCFFALGEYAKRSTVSGLLVPDTGVLKIYSPQLGVIAQKLVREGQQVRKGQILFVISSERQNKAATGIHATVSQQVALRMQSLRDEISRKRRLQQEEEAALSKKIEGLQAEQSKIIQQLNGQRVRVDLAAAGVERTSQLLAQGYVSTEMAQQKQADQLDQRSRYEALERDRLSIIRELDTQRRELMSLPLRQHNELAQLERMLASTDQELAESESKREIAVVAPEDGIATAILPGVGQTVEGGQSLATVIPARAKLSAHLIAPSRAIGFIRANNQVLLRYQAYPYQKFGHAIGTVISVSRVAMPTNEAVGLLQGSGSGEQVYLITVALARQTITAFGKEEPLQAGMLVDADILQEKRKLYEWVLEPLFTLSGKL